MFEVLVFVYENYWRGEACPEGPQLGRKLSAVGFESDEIQQALAWLEGLRFAAQGAAILPTAVAMPTPDPVRTSMRIYAAAEQDHLGYEGLRYLSFLVGAGGLSETLREIVIDRAMAAPGDPLPIDDLKIIVLMVYWSMGKEPDALLLDELCDDVDGRLPH
jgi:Smg protein